MHLLVAAMPLPPQLDWSKSYILYNIGPIKIDLAYDLISYNFLNKFKNLEHNIFEEKRSRVSSASSGGN